jgi:hypothetical protein
MQQGGVSLIDLEHASLSIDRRLAGAVEIALRVADDVPVRREAIRVGRVVPRMKRTVGVDLEQ